MIEPLRSELLLEVECLVFVTEASTLGLEPGEWPDYLQCAPGFGNGMAFIRQHPEFKDDGDLAAVNYRQVAGCVLVRIFND